MFYRRLKILLVLIGSAAMILGGRLAHLQLANGQEYLRGAQNMFARPLKPIPAIRGRILARAGGGEGTVVLVSDKPCFDLCVYYPVLNAPGHWKQANRWLGQARLGAMAQSMPVKHLVFEKIDQMWGKISLLTGVDLSELSARRARIVKWVEKRKKAVERVHEGADYPIVEQRMFHPILTDLDNQTLINQLRLELADNPWVMVRNSTRRQYHQGDLVCHLLGRVVRESGVMVERFTVLDDEYLPGERRGMGGLEGAYEQQLGGERGWVELGGQQADVVLAESRDGRDVLLTIDVELQRYAKDRLVQQIEELPYATGGAAVVLKLDGNEILVAASVPGFDPATVAELYNKLNADRKHLPLVNRVLMGQYPPGSIVKPMVLAAGITDKKVNAGQTINCIGRFSAESEKFRCWKPYGHGQIAAVRAVAESCDVYFYNLGQWLGAEHLCWWYRQLGLGQSSGSSLPEEQGLVPTRDFVQRREGRAMSKGDARNLSIGQGYLEVTPIQAVNMLASLLRGKYQPVRLVVDQAVGSGWHVGFSQEATALVRQGMFEVVNTAGGTAQRYVSTPVVSIAGKTGSAQASTRRIGWDIKYTDQNGKVIVDRILDWDSFVEDCPIPREQISRSAVTWPTLRAEDRFDKLGRKRHILHAWFVGYAPADNPKVAVVVLIEYGMHGNSQAGPVARDIILKCLELGYLGR